MTPMLPLLAAAALAQGFDAAGPDAPPDGLEVADPLWGWGGVSPQSAQVSGRAQVIDGLLERTVLDGGDEVTTTVVDDLVGIELGAVLPLEGRVGLGASLPVWVASRGEAGGGPAFGDMRLYLPIRIVDAVSVVPQLRVPTGAGARFLGEDWPALLVDGTGRVQVEQLAMAGDLGIELAPTRDTPEWPGGVGLRGAGSVGWVPSDVIGVHLEARLRQPLAAAEGRPSELGLSVKGRPVDGMWVSGGLGRALTQGVGAARLRAQLSVGWSFGDVDDGSIGPAIVGPDDAPDPIAPGEPVPVVVRVIGPDGRPVEGDVRLEGPSDPGPPEVGADGALTWVLPQGTWTVVAGAEGLGGQERTVVIDPVRTAEVEVDVLLAPQVDGGGSLRVRVTDANGTPVEDAEVRLGDLDLGTTATGGDLLVRGVAFGAAEVVVRSNRGHMATALPVSVGSDTEVEVILDWAPGSVLVRARGPDDAVTDGLVAVIGPEWVPTRRLGADGIAQFTLAPGLWRALVSSPTLGSQERVFEVSDRPGEVVELDVVLQSVEDGVGDLTVRVVDPDGTPLADVDVLLDGRPVGATSPRGELTLLGLQDGVRTLRVEGMLLEGVEGEVEVGTGAQVADVVARWVPGVVEVTVRGPDGAPEDALVAFDGPEPRAPMGLGPDGRELVMLPEGSWTLLVSSPTWGSQMRQLEVGSQGGRREQVLVDLMPVDDGGGVLSVGVTDPRDLPVDGATVLVRGVPAGSTNQGAAVVQGLALGRAQVDVSGPALASERAVVRITDDTELDVELDWAPGALEVRVSGDEGTDDVLLFVTGGRTLPPAHPDAEGARLLALEPGRWWVLASSERYATMEQEIVLPASAQLSTLDFELEPAVSDRGSLLVRVVDESGRPVEGVEIRRGSEVVGVSSPSGAVTLDDLDPAEIELSLGPTAVTAGIEIGATVKAGSQRRQVVVPYLPRPVRISVVDAQGRPLPGASVRVIGRDELDLGAVGGDAVAAVGLVPGAWRITASVKGGGGSASLVLSPGVDEVEVEVEVAEISSSFAAGGLTLSDPVRFDLDQATLRPEAEPILDDVARLLLATPEIVRVEVQGHTDDQGGPAYNLELSTRRSDVVRAALVARGVTPDRLVARGYGLMRPVTLDRSDAARARNRRVEMVILEER